MAIHLPATLTSSPGPQNPSTRAKVPPLDRRISRRIFQHPVACALRRPSSAGAFPRIRDLHWPSTLHDAPFPCPKTMMMMAMLLLLLLLPLLSERRRAVSRDGRFPRWIDGCG